MDRQTNSHHLVPSSHALGHLGQSLNGMPRISTDDGSSEWSNPKLQFRENKSSWWAIVADDWLLWLLFRSKKRRIVCLFFTKQMIRSQKRILPGSSQVSGYPLVILSVPWPRHESNGFNGLKYVKIDGSTNTWGGRMCFPVYIESYKHHDPQPQINCPHFVWPAWRIVFQVKINYNSFKANQLIRDLPCDSYETCQESKGRGLQQLVKRKNMGLMDYGHPSWGIPYWWVLQIRMGQWTMAHLAMETPTLNHICINIP